MELALLAVVAARPSHGWAILEQARLRSEGIFEFGEGAVYPVLHKLERDGLLRSDWAEVGGRSRRTYHITRRGRAELERRRDDWSRMAQGMRALLQDI